VGALAERKKPQTDHQAPRTGARNPRSTTVLLLTGIVISIGVAVAVGYFFDSQLVVWSIRGTAIILAGVFLSLLIRLGYRYEWTGFGEAALPKPENREVRPKKTVWDWLQLLIVPFVLALIAVAFTLYQEGRQSRIERQRTENALEIEKQRAQDVALQDYLDQMGNLLLNKDRPLRQSKEGDEVRTLARARTVTVLERMDPSRKGQIVQFLSEAGLVQRVEGEPIISLDEANLEGADLGGADLFDANLLDAYLLDAYLEGADLRGADLRGAYLEGADLEDADLYDANLEGANLEGADLEDAYLEGADLEGADLRDANLEGALLEGARGIGKEQLEKQAKNLRGATMPDGSKHP
jgi:uncharacterized protein YjbI with pentapeptide repeats